MLAVRLMLQPSAGIQAGWYRPLTGRGARAAESDSLLMS
jgi:hypothetical protein